MAGPPSTHEPWPHPKDLLYGELAEGSRPVGRPRLHYKGICKPKWESYVDDRAKWRTSVREGVMRAEERRRAEQEDERRRRKQRETSSSSPTNHRCSGCNCGNDCQSRSGLLQSHSRILTSWTEFFPSFYGPSAKRADHENKEEKNEDP